MRWPKLGVSRIWEDKRTIKEKIQTPKKKLKSPPLFFKTFFKFEHLSSRPVYFSPHRRISEILRHNKFIYFALQNIVPAAYKYHFVHELAKLNHLHSVLNRCFILDNIINSMCKIIHPLFASTSLSSAANSVNLSYMSTGHCPVHCSIFAVVLKVKW